MTVKKKVKSYPHVVDYLKELPFYKKHIEKASQTLKIIDLFSEITFY